MTAVGLILTEGWETDVRKKEICVVLAFCLCIWLSFPVRAAGEETEELIRLYETYEAEFSAIEHVDDIERYGYSVIGDESYPVQFESFGGEEVQFLPILHDTYHRMAVIIADSDGNVLFKTNQLEVNYKWPGRMEQPAVSLISVSFKDMNMDGLRDITLITGCRNRTGKYAEKIYKVGDVLFQKDGSFYRDWRISDKINRFSMNKSIDFIASYVRDGISTEILYTAATLDELLDNGFEIFEQQCYKRRYEKHGVLRVVPGVIKMAEYNVFMIYLVNEQGYIVWSFQPMGDYDNLYALKGMDSRDDLDGDGMKDLLVLSRFSYADSNGEMVIDTVCSIYYQRTDGFEEDTEFTASLQIEDDEKVKVSDLVAQVREYWGWKTEE